MNEAMIQDWNSLVCPDDTVYMLGDVAFLSAQKATEIVRRLNGRKILVEGNHDHKLVKDPDFCACFEEIHKYLEIVYNKHKIVMSHYPIYDHNGAGRGSIMLHGHRHGNPHNIPGRIMDVGMDATGKIVSKLDDIISLMLKIQPMPH
jgi:calcineurin-like phosphoesterase family protein